MRQINSNPVTVPLDGGRWTRAKLAFVLLANEQTVEADVFDMLPEAVGAHFTRMPMSNDVTFEALAGMAPDIAASAALLLPDDRPNVICYTCNLGTMVIGEDRVLPALVEGRDPTVAATTVMTGVVRALRALQARRLSVVVPYTDDVNPYVDEFLTQNGFEIVEFQGMNLRQNSDIDRVDPQFIRSYAKSADRPEADAVVICCGALRAAGIIEQLETDIGKPVVTSNQAMVWDCLRLSGVDDKIEGHGRLFQIGLDGHREALVDPG